MSLGQIDRVVHQLIAWLKERGRCAFQSYVSQAVRVTGACRERCPDLRGLVAIVGGEPLTDIKRREIERTGASVYHRYAATEVGTIGMGCGNPAESDDVHLMSDMVCVGDLSSQSLEEVLGARTLHARSEPYLNHRVLAGCPQYEKEVA